MVRVDRVAADNYEDANNKQQVVDASPPGVSRVRVASGALNLTDDGTDKGDAPSELGLNVSDVTFGQTAVLASLTVAMESVARAKGSPRMLPIWIPLRVWPYIILELSIFRRDGEATEPYDGIRYKGREGRSRRLFGAEKVGIEERPRGDGS